MTFLNTGGGGSICLVWICTTDNFLTHPRKSFSTKIERLSDQCKNTNQKSTKELLLDELEVDFSSIKEINWCEKLWTPKWRPYHDFTQSCGGINLYVRFLYLLQTIFQHTQGKFQDQNILIQSMWTNKSITNDVSIKTKKTKEMRRINPKM